MSGRPPSWLAPRACAVALALAHALACSGRGEPARAPAPPGAAARSSPAAEEPAAASPPATSIGLVDAFPLELDWPVVPAADAHDAPLPPGVLPDDFAIVVRPRLGAAPLVELRPRAGMSGRWELVAAEVETPDDPSVDLSESLVWSVEVSARRVAGLYAFALGHDELVCGAPTGVAARYGRSTRRLGCDDGPASLALRARLDQLVLDFAPAP